MKHSMLVWPVVAFALFAGCTSERASAGARRLLANTNWRVESIDGKAVVSPSEANKSLQMVLGESNHRVAAFGGVNRFGGSYEISGSGITFGPLIGTKMAGSPELNQQEKRFAEALAAVNQYRLAGDSLVLLKDDKPLVSLKAHP